MLRQNTHPAAVPEAVKEKLPEYCVRLDCIDTKVSKVGGTSILAKCKA